MLTEEGRSLGKAMVEASKEWKVMEPRIGNSSDTAMETAIKEIILQMLQFEPAHRIAAAQVVDRLTKLKGDKREVEQPTATQEEPEGNETEVEQPTATQEELEGNKTKGRQSRIRMPKWWPGSKK